MDSTASNSSSSADSDESGYIDIADLIDGLFPYDEPYDDQYEGIEATIRNFRNKGFTVTEGACGTGKTLIALISALGVIRDPQTEFEQALVITSFKQQQSAFEDDIESINAAIEDEYGFAREAPTRYQPVTGLSLVGKGDLCPYTDSGAIDQDHISPRCSALINTTTKEASRESVTAQTKKADGARSIVAAAQSQIRDEVVGPSTDNSHSNIEDAEHPPDPTQFNGNEVCPYYAQYLVDDELGNEKVKYQWNMLDADTLRQKAAQLGTCPYMSMREGMSKAEIVVGNYAHVFHDATAEAVTQSLINGNTLLIVDEAHMLTEKVRQYEGVTTTRADIIEAVDELDRIDSQLLNVPPEAQDQIREEFRRYDTSEDGLRRLRELIGELKQMVERVAGAHVGDTDSPSYEEKIPFRDPEELKDDRFDKWIEYINFDDSFIQRAKHIGNAAGSALRIIDNETDSGGKSSYKVEAIGKLLTKKFYTGQADHFFEVTLTGAASDGGWSYSASEEVYENYDITLDLYNCMPAQAIRRRLSKFGGGMLMSATLSPTDVYTETVGVSDLPNPINKQEFSLRFPESNRGSYVVPLSEYTSSNRGNTSDSNVTRDQYEQTITEIINTVDGNTLIGMPSYDEAEWIKTQLENRVSNPIYLDEPSTNDETMALKSAFEAQDDGILVTSLRGTLTEGVDYSGNKLSNVIVVGVPLTFPYSNEAEAIKTAYAVNFGRAEAFDLSHTLPAVYKTRQALGRVIRSGDDVGTRILLDERYTADHYRSVTDYLSDQEQSEYEVIQPENIGTTLTDFWSQAR